MEFNVDYLGPSCTSWVQVKLKNDFDLLLIVGSGEVVFVFSGNWFQSMVLCLEFNSTGDHMDEAKTIGAIIAALSLFISPIVMFILKRTEDRKDQQQIFDRQDVVASNLLRFNQNIRDNFEILKSKVDQVHILVNSEKTENIQEVLNATKASIGWMQAILDL